MVDFNFNHHLDRVDQMVVDVLVLSDLNIILDSLLAYDQFLGKYSMVLRETSVTCYSKYAHLSFFIVFILNFKIRITSI